VFKTDNRKVTVLRDGLNFTYQSGFRVLRCSAAEPVKGIFLDALWGEHGDKVTGLNLGSAVRRHDGRRSKTEIL